MKRSIMIIGLLLFCTMVQGQTFSEWFKQKKTQKKYLINQIVALQAYGKLARDGYGMVQGGLKFISDLKDGELSLHTLYFGSLRAVNPYIRKYAKVGDIIKMQLRIAQIQVLVRKGILTEYFSAEDSEYVILVYNRLLEDCIGCLDELIDVITPGKYEMKDDERIERIDRLYLEMTSMVEFAQSFQSDVQLAINAAKNNKQDVNLIRGLYGLNQK